MEVTPALKRDSALAFGRMTCNGLGLARLTDFIEVDAVDDGHLIPVLEDCYPDELFPIWAFFAPAERVPLTIRAFRNFLMTELFGSAIAR